MRSSLVPWSYHSTGVFLLVLLAGLTWNTQTVAAQENCKLVDGYGTEPPYHYPNDQGNIIGIDADILRIVLEDLGCALVFEERLWKRTLFQIESGELDVTLGASFKDKRAKFAHYSVPYRGQPHVVFENKSPGSGTSTLAKYLKNGHSLSG